MANWPGVNHSVQARVFPGEKGCAKEHAGFASGAPGLLSKAKVEQYWFDSVPGGDGGFPCPTEFPVSGHRGGIIGDSLWPWTFTGMSLPALEPPPALSSGIASEA